MSMIRGQFIQSTGRDPTAFSMPVGVHPHQTGPDCQFMRDGKAALPGAEPVALGIQSMQREVEDDPVLRSGWRAGKRFSRSA